MGDLNSNANFDHKRRKYKHFAMINFLKIKKVSSLYHDEFSGVHGEESGSTFYMHRYTLKPFHLDYVFVTDKWLTKSTLKVGESKEWLFHSYHLPILADGHSV